MPALRRALHIKALVDYEQLCGIKPACSETTMHPDEVTVQDMKRALETPALGIHVVDVREPAEFEIARIAGTTLLPLSELEQRHGELNPGQTIYLHCKIGGRSLKAVQFLKQKGFKSIKSVRGGLRAWSVEIDPGVPAY